MLSWTLDVLGKMIVIALAITLSSPPPAAHARPATVQDPPKPGGDGKKPAKKRRPPKEIRTSELAKLFPIRTTFRGKAVTFDELVKLFTGNGQLPDRVSYRLFKKIDSDMRPVGRAGIFSRDTIRSPRHEDRERIVKQLNIRPASNRGRYPGCRSLTYELRIAATRSKSLSSPVIELGDEKIGFTVYENPDTGTLHLCLDPDSYESNADKIDHNRIEDEDLDSTPEEEPANDDAEKKRLQRIRDAARNEITLIRSIDLGKGGIEIEFRRRWEHLRNKLFDGVLEVKFNATLDGNMSYRKGRKKIQALYFIKGYR